MWLQHTAHAHTPTLMHTFGFGVCEIKSLQISILASRSWRRKHRWSSVAHTRVHITCLHAYTYANTHIWHTHAYTAMQMRTRRGNPGRFISGGLQHSGCLSHFIGHRGRTGMGLFKSNPARPTHTYTHLCAHTLANIDRHFLFSGLTDASQNRWRGKEGGRRRQAGGREKVKKKLSSTSEETKRGWSTQTNRRRKRERPVLVRHHKYRHIMYIDNWMGGLFWPCRNTGTQNARKLQNDDCTMSHMSVCVCVCVCTLSMEKICVFGVQCCKTEI